MIVACKCMSLIGPSAEVEIVNASGALRVTIKHKGFKSRLLFEVLTIGVAIFVGGVWPAGRREMAPLATTVVMVLIADLFRLVTAEVVEFTALHITLSQTGLLWKRAAKYALDSCSELEWLKAWGSPGVFRFKYGKAWVTFGRGLTWEQAFGVLAELRNSLPNVDRHLLSRASLPKGFDPILHGKK